MSARRSPRSAGAERRAVTSRLSRPTVMTLAVARWRARAPGRSGGSAATRTPPAARVSSPYSSMTWLARVPKTRNLSIRPASSRTAGGQSSGRSVQAAVIAPYVWAHALGTPVLPLVWMSRATSRGRAETRGRRPSSDAASSPSSDSTFLSAVPASAGPASPGRSVTVTSTPASRRRAARWWSVSPGRTPTTRAPTVYAATTAARASGPTPSSRATACPGPTPRCRRAAATRRVMPSRCRPLTSRPRYSKTVRSPAASSRSRTAPGNCSVMALLRGARCGAGRGDDRLVAHHGPDANGAVSERSENRAEARVGRRTLRTVRAGRAPTGRVVLGWRDGGVRRSSRRRGPPRHPIRRWYRALRPSPTTWHARCVPRGRRSLRRRRHSPRSRLPRRSRPADRRRRC